MQTNMINTINTAGIIEYHLNLPRKKNKSKTKKNNSFFKFLNLTLA